VANEIKRIEREFIFQNLIERQSPVEIHYQNHRLGYMLKRSTEDRLFMIPLVSDPPEIPEGALLTVFLKFRGQVMTFRTKVRSWNPGELAVEQSQVLFRDLSRGFERILRPQGISVSFVMQGERVLLDYPTSDMYDPVEPPEEEPGFDPEQISELLGAFRTRAEEFSDENKIVMFRERTPESYQENLVARTGKFLVVPVPTERAKELPLHIRDRVLIRQEIVDLERTEGEQMLDTLEKIGGMVDDLDSKSLARELYCPVLYHQFVIGYLYLCKQKGDPVDFRTGAYDFLGQFARILSYSLERNGYFKPVPVEEEYTDTGLMDISGSGLLFSHSLDGPSINLYTELELRILLDNKVLPARGRVMRKWKDSARSYYGIQFVDMATEHMEALFDRLYGEQYRGEADTIGPSDFADPDEEHFSP
jgi:hypothetical protein